MEIQMALEVRERTQRPMVDKEIFRNAMARLAGAVNVIATSGPAGRTGFTGTAVCSVSDTPPTLLVCLNQNSRGTPVILANGVFSVNTLVGTDESLADFFAGRSGASAEERFQKGDWMTLETGAPVLRTAVVSFDCRTVQVRRVATHNIFFATIEAVHFGEPGPSLIYHDRKYKHI